MYICKHIFIEMSKKVYSQPKVTFTSLDSEINLVLMSNPPEDPQMFMGNSTTDGGTDFQFMNPLKWFR